MKWPVGLGVSIGAMRAAFQLSVVGIDFDVDVRQSRDVGQLSLVVGGRFWFVRDDDRKNPKVARPQAPQMEISDVVALRLEPVADQHGSAQRRAEPQPPT
jgi:hypothetical protein